MKRQLDWRVGYCDSAQQRPQEWYPATVPGAVQLDYAAAKKLPSYMLECNYEQYRWMEDVYWVYATTFDATKLSARHLTLVSKGIDFRFWIYANGECRYTYEGMYHTVRVDLSDLVGQVIELEIVLAPVPKSTVKMQYPNTREEANQATKPAVSYGWDFHPRLIPSGIWDETYLELSELGQEVNPRITYSLREDFSAAEVTLSADLASVEEWRVLSPDGATVFCGTKPNETFTLEQPLLWWCNGYGVPNLYRWELRYYDGEELVTKVGKIGFKTISLEMNEGTWEVEGFPKTRACPPITVCLTGVRLFIKGTNWVAPEIFYGTLDKARYEEQLTLIKEAHLNLIRCWGGAIVNKEAFFALCDEMGLLVWQEFPLGCNDYTATPAYMDLLEREAVDIIQRVSSHACLALWCGGNELFNNWSGMTDQALPLRLLNKLTFEYTPGIPFLPTSPLMGMAHGGYRFITDNREVNEVIRQCHQTAYTEMGVPALSRLETMQLITDTDKLYPLVPNEITLAHHAFDAWQPGDTWCGTDDIARYFDSADSLEELIAQSQYLQAVGYRFIFEEARRQKPYCSMVINWCFNEPWPCLANNSVVSYPNYPKASYAEIALACRSVEATARYKKLSYNAGETLEFDLWMLNDSLSAVEGETVSASVRLGDRPAVHLLDWSFPQLAPGKNMEGPTVRYLLPDAIGVEDLTITLSCGAYSSEYRLKYRSSVPTEKKVKALNV